MKKRKKSLLCLILLIIVVAFTSCDSLTKEKDPIVDYILINPSQLVIAKGLSYQYTAIVHGTNKPSQDVVWNVIGHNSLATSINSNGELTIGSNETASTIFVRATSTFDTSKIGTVNVTIRQPELYSFGGLMWQVLSKDEANNRALLITQDIIELNQWHTSDIRRTWEQSSLRAYLNNEFYNQFSPTDRERIRTTIVNPGNLSDKIFLLSVYEARNYFWSDGDRVAVFNGAAYVWWLRTLNSGNDSSPAGVRFDGSIVAPTPDDSFIIVQRMTEYYGVRPALWLNL